MHANPLLVSPFIRGRILALILLMFLASSAFSNDSLRIIAILENERMLEAEPDIKLADYFRFPSEQIRIRALLAAARIGNQAILPFLEPLLEDKNANVRKYVAFAIGQIRSKNGLLFAARLLKDEDAEVRRLAIEAIGRIGGLDTTVLVVPFLRDKNAFLREQSALALALIKDKGTVDVLIELANEEDPAQWSYVYALYRLADERSLAVLHKVLANPLPSPSTEDPSALLFALKALWSMKKPLTEEEVERLLQHKDARVQQNTLDVIGASNDKTACVAIQKHYSTMNHLTRMKALEAMGLLGCVIDERPATAGLLGGWIMAQAKTQKENALSLLQEGAKHESWTVRWRTAQALVELPAGSAIPMLKVLSQDSDSAVRLAAFDSLTKYLPDTAEVFLPLLGHKDFALRATAVDALGKTKERRFFAALIKTYDASSDPSEVEGRVALLDVLADFNTSEAMPIFERALLDPEYTIRRHAIDGIKKLVGTQYHWKGDPKDPEDFLYQQGKVPAKKMNEYSPDFGRPQDSIEITMKLEKGDVVIRLSGSDAPLHAENIRKLADGGFYNGLRIHRVVPNFVIQGGDPRGDGWGGAGKVIHDQVNLLIYKRGTVGMPIAGKDTGGSQFFITQSRQPHLDGNYTIYGEVISGMDVVDRTEVGDKILSIFHRRER
ncbi:HEAT repeat domain-containing protein [bacterium]|nr:HEAT repeat domain-containing protein [bacterium]